MKIPHCPGDTTHPAAEGMDIDQKAAVTVVIFADVTAL